MNKLLTPYFLLLTSYLITAIQPTLAQTSNLEREETGIPTFEIETNETENLNPATTISEPATLPNFDQEEAIINTEDLYTLGSGDQLRMDVFDVPEYSGEYQVLVDGTLNLPIIGGLRVQGLTLEQASQQISQKYVPYLTRPLITLSLTTPRPLQIAIAGEINRPGSYRIRPEQGKFPRVTQVITLADGITRSADVRAIQVRRLYQGREQVIDVDLWALLRTGDLQQDFILRDGDSIFIPTTPQINASETRQLASSNLASNNNQPFKIAVVGEVNRPGAHLVQSGDQSTVTSALEAAGGIKPLADIRHIQVRRPTVTGTEQLLEVDLWALLQAGDLSQDVILQEADTIVVPTAQDINDAEAGVIAEASFSPETIRVNVIGEAVRPGSIELPPNTPLNQAILSAGGFNERAKKNKVDFIRLNPNGTVATRQVEVDFAQGRNDVNNPVLRNNDVIVIQSSLLANVSDGIGLVSDPLSQILRVLTFPFQLFNLFDN